MDESLVQLLDRMHATRGSLAEQLKQIPSRPPAKADSPRRIRITATQLGLGIGVAVAMRVLFPARRRRPEQLK